MDQYDVVVVGAGLAGLMAAVTAARAGASVLVLDRQTELGGRARTSEYDGALFNQGAHALYRTGPGMRVLGSLGISPRGALAPLEAARALLNGKVAALPLDLSGTVRTSLLSPRAKLAFAKAMVSLQRANPTELHHLSLQDWIARVTSNPDVTEVLLALSRLSTYAHSADLLSAGASVDQMQRGRNGVLYLHGGWRQLVNELVRRLDEAGGGVEAGIAVTSIEDVPSGWTVSGADRSWSARSVVIAGLSPQMTAELAGLDAGAFDRAGPPAEAAVLDLTLHQPPPTTFILGMDTPTYFSVQGPPADLAPDGRAAAVAMKYLPIGESTDMHTDRAQLEELASLASAQVSSSRFLRRMTVTHGIPLASQGGLGGRPGVATDHTGIFIAGDWVGPEGLLADASLASGEASGVAAAKHSSTSREESLR